MAKQTTAAAWAAEMAALTGCEQTIWVHSPEALSPSEATGRPLALSWPDAAGADSLRLLLRGGMADYAMYAVPLAPGLRAPWVQPGLLLTDDPATARWFAALPGANGAVDDLPDGEPFLRVLHLSHGHGSALAALPEEHTLWALGADIDSLRRAVSLGLGSWLGRWGDWLTVPLRVTQTTGILSPSGTPHWLQIGPDGQLWACDPWGMTPPTAGLTALVVDWPALTDGLCQTDWPTMVLCAALAMDSPFAMGDWYPAGLGHYLNQWAHTEHIVPRPPRCYVGNPAAQPPVETVSCPLGQRAKDVPLTLAPLQTRVAALQATLAAPGAGTLYGRLAARWDELTRL